MLSQKLEGTPFIRNYTPNEYAASSDVWAIAQDKQGIMYFGNLGGVLRYDGSRWLLIPVSNNSVVRSIAIDSSGIIYVGAVGEFGFLEPDEKGSLVYRSLIDKLPENEREFADVWKTYATPEGIYFQTFSKLFRFKDNSMKIWKPETSFHFSYYLQGNLYINEREKGLKYLIKDELRLTDGGNIFSGLRIYSMLPYPQNRILIATRERGLFLMSGMSVSKTDSMFKCFPAEVNGHLINDQVYAGVHLDNNRFAFATLKNGVVIINERGNIIEVFNKKNGLQEDIIKNVNTDNQHNLWIALGKGISHIEISAPLNSFNDAQGIKGSIQSIIKNKSVYVATSLGVFISDGDHFVPVEGITSQTWDLKKYINKKDTLLLASSETGVFEVKGFKGSLIVEDFGYVLHQSKVNPERVFIGTHDGLSSIRYENKHWVYEDYFRGIDKEIRFIDENENGDLWLGTPYEGLIKIHFNTKGDSRDSLITSWHIPYTIRNYSTVNGLPEQRDNIPCNLNGKIVFATSKGVYEFNELKSKFLRSGFLNKELQQHQVFRFVPKDSASIWLSTFSSPLTETGIANLQTDGSYSWYYQPFLKISDREIHAIFPDDNGITWFGGPDGLLRYDANIKKDFSQPFYALIRSVGIGKDSLLFGGSFYKQEGKIKVSISDQPDSQKQQVGYEFNSMQFEYSATSFGSEKNNSFNVYLQGYDNEWTGWNVKTLKEYTNLKEGNYTFHVKAKNIYGTESIEATYQFTILPPWYRTVWAYMAYVILFIGFVYIIIRLSVRRLVKAKTKLEETVRERTAEVVSQKHLIEEKHKEITDSINYAERIQRSFLATKELLDQNLNEYFVFFQPKDVVSGDFYWAATVVSGKSAGGSKKETGGSRQMAEGSEQEAGGRRQETVRSKHEAVGSKQEAVGSRQRPEGSGESEMSGSAKFILVTADSTGHGVPGAIMSILNITSLENAVGQGLSDPSEILNKTRSNIIDRLKKDGSAEGGKDGMDASLICFDFVHKKITYAAANNPVWIVRDKQILEFNPDKMPVGKHDNDKVSFTQHTIDLQKGDMIYALTDGMPDQFGGPKGKKFMYKQLKEFLISISHLPMEEQKQRLKTSLNNWKGELEQVDDVCIIGVRF